MPDGSVDSLDTNALQSWDFFELHGFEQVATDRHEPFAFADPILSSLDPETNYPAVTDDVVRNLVFINQDVDQLDQLLADLESLSEEFQVVLVDQQTDGLQQVSDILKSHTNIESLHFVTHGADGQVNLGNSTLSMAALKQHQTQLASWSAHLSRDADVLFYGCDLASTSEGQQFAESFAQITGADVAASDDLSGHENLGGDWNLEFHFGQIESEVVFSSQLQNQWWGTLATYTVTSTADDGSVGTLRWAIDQANTNAGADNIVFNIPNTDSGHVYYRDDGGAGTLSLVASTTLDDASIADFDPDYVFSPHSWFRIDLDNTRPQLSISDEVHVDGYSQPGTTQNSLSIGHDASLRIELTNRVAADGKRGLTFDTGANGSTLQGLVINDFSGVGVMIDYDVHNVTIQGNYIGTDITGTLDLGNGDAGIQVRSNDNLIGGSNLVDRNIISGSNGRGIAYFSFGTLTGNVAENNYIGVDATGLVGLGNDSYGIQLYNTDGTQIINNVIGDSEFEGILFRAGSDVHNSVVQGNLIGIGADGATLVGNGADGIAVESDAATGNLIGGSGAGEGNAIGGNLGHGISFTGAGVSDNIVLGNSIGTDAAGVLNLGNGGSGVLIAGGSYKQTIGGINPGEPNIIAFNNLDGVAVLSGTGTSIRGNVFKSNGDLAIDLVGNNGPNLNDTGDGDGGTNYSQNYPVLTSAVIDGLDISIAATLNSNPGTIGIVVDFYWSASGDVSGHGEAENYIGSVLVNTDGSGNATINQTFVGASVPVGAVITATATDPTLNTSEFSVNIASTPANTAPVLVANQLTLNEGDTALLSAANLDATDATDPDSSLVFNVSNVVGGHFALTLTPLTPITSFTKAQVDGGAIVFVDNDDETAPSYDVEVTDGSLTDGPAAGAINFTNVNDAPTATIIPSAYGLSEDNPAAPLGGLSISDVDAGGSDLEVTLSVGNGVLSLVTTTGLSFTGGANDSASMTVRGSLTNLNGALGTLMYEPDPNYSGTDTLTLFVDDLGNTGGGSLTDSDTASIVVTAVNDPPVITSDGGGVTANVNVVENTTAVTTVTSTDQELDSRTYSLSGGADQALFNIDSSTGVLTFLSGRDFETPTDLNTDGIYEVEITVDDGSGTDIQTLFVTVTDTNEAPVITSDGGGSTASINVAENTAAVTTVTATDEDLPANLLTYSISGGADQALFNIDSATGVLTFVSPRDFELLTDFDLNGIYEVQVTVDDGNLGTDVQDISVTITDQNDAPVITSNGGGAIAAINVAENITAVTTVTATDQDLPANSLTYSISGGADQSLFNIDSATGVLTFVSPRDYEAFTDADANGVYDVQVTVDDGNLTTDVQDISVTVTDANDAPAITSDGGGASAAISVAENTTAITTVSAVDEDLPANALTYSITGGADSAHFAIDGSTGILTFVSGRDFEVSTDANSDNDYIVVVTASDGLGGNDTQTITVSVVDANESPSTSGIPDLGVDEDSIDRFYNLHAAFADPEDPDSALTYSIENVTNASLFDGFSVTPTNLLQLDFSDDQNGIAFVTVRATDTGGLFVETTFRVEVNPVNDDPYVSSSVVPIVVNEDAASTVLDLDTVFDDVDIFTDGDVLGYSLVSSDNPALVATLFVGSNFTLDYQADRFGTATIVVLATDLAGRTVSESISITVNPVNDSPIIDDQLFHLDENSPIGTSVGLVAASPGIGDPLGGDAISHYAVLGGTGSPYFAVDSLTGEITVLDASVLNFEATPSFTLDIQVADSGVPGLTDVGTVTVQLNDMDEVPSIVAAPTGVMENNTLVGVVSATDQDDFPLTFLISGGADSSSFTIDSVTGQLSFLFSPDFEAPADFDSNNRYEVLISVTDAVGLTDVQFVTVAIADDADTPAPTLPTLPGSVPDPADPDDDHEEVLPPPYVRTANTLSETADELPSSAASLSFQSGPLEFDSLSSSIRVKSVMIESDTTFAYMHTNASGGADDENRFEISDLNFVHTAGWLWHDLDKLKNELSFEGRFSSFWTVTAPGITTTLSVGYVMWLLKGGQLVAGLMAQVPAWKLIAIDPLPILSSIDEEELDVEGDSLASMVDDANANRPEASGFENTNSKHRTNLKNCQPGNTLAWNEKP